MFNTQQEDYVLPYQRRLDQSANQKVGGNTGAPLPMQRPGQQVDSSLPVPPKQEDPMQHVQSLDFFKANQGFMADPEYASGFQQLASEARALRDQVQKGYMPDVIAQERLQSRIFDLRKEKMKAAEQAQQQQPAQQGMAPEGALSGNTPDAPPGGIMMRNADGSPVLDDAGKPIYEIPAGTNPQTGQPQGLPTGKATLDPNAGAPTTEQLEQEAANGGLAGEDNQPVEQQAQAAQQQAPQQLFDPRFAVQDGSIDMIAQQNAAALARGMPQQPEMTQDQMANAQLNAAGETLADQANQPKSWYQSEPFIYSMTRFVLGLLDGEEVSSAFTGANESYQMLNGMEKRKAFEPELRKRGYSPAQIEEYMRTGKSDVLREKKWSNVGQGIAMSNDAEFMRIPGYDPNFISAKDAMTYNRMLANDEFRNQMAMMNYDRMNQYQQAQLDLSREQLDFTKSKPDTLRAVDIDGNKYYLTNAQIEQVQRTGQIPEEFKGSFGMSKANPELLKEGWYQDMSKEFNSKKYQQYQKSTTWRNVYFDSIKKNMYKPLRMDALDTILAQAATEGGRDGVTWAWLRGKMSGDQFLALKDAMLATIPDLREDSGASINLGEYRTELHALAQRPGDSIATIEGRAIANTLSRAIGHNKYIKPKDVNDIRQNFMARAIDPESGKTIVKVRDPNDKRGFRVVELPL